MKHRKWQLLYGGNIPGYLDEGAGGGQAKTQNAGGNSGDDDQADDDKQAALDAQFAQRAKRAEDAERKRILKLLNVKDEDELKTIVDAKRQADDQAKTEKQKLEDRAQNAETELEKLKGENATRLAEMQKRILDSEIKLFATRPVTDKDGKVIRAAFRPESLDAVLALLDRTQLSEKDGKFEGIDKALDALAKAHTYMLTGTTPQGEGKGTPKGAHFKTGGAASQETSDDSGLAFESL